MKLWEVVKTAGGIYVVYKMVAGCLYIAKQVGKEEAYREMERDNIHIKKGEADEPVVVNVMGTDYVLKLEKKQ